jgi:hypothetical protein
MVTGIRGVMFWAVGLSVMASAASAAGGGIPVRVGFNVSKISDPDRQQKTLGPGEPIFIQRLTAVKSVTLRDEGPGLPTGARLLLASGPDGREFYCGAPTPKGTARLMTGANTSQWICFEDVGADGVFETVWSTPYNGGARVPSFGSVTAPIPISLHYAVDPEDQRDFYETTIMHEKSFNIYGRMFFNIKVRRQGETEWLNMVSTSSGIRGGTNTLAAKSLPATLHINGAKIRVLSATKDQMTVQVESAYSGYVAYGTSPGF